MKLLYIENICYDGCYKIDRYYNNETKRFLFNVVLMVELNEDKYILVDCTLGSYSTEKKARRKLKRLTNPNWFQKIVDLFIVASFKYAIHLLK